MKARDIMASPVVTLSQDATVEDAARRLLDTGVGSLVVVDPEGRVAGILTDTDFSAKEEGIPFSLGRAPKVLGQWLGPGDVERVYAAARVTPVVQIMSRPVRTLRSDASVDDVVRLMLRHHVHRIPIVEDGKPVGIVSRHDLLRLLLRKIGTPPPPA